MRRWGATHIHCHLGDSKLYAGYYCAAWLGLPITVTVHAYERAHGNMSDSRPPITTRILMVGEFREKKGHQILLSAVKKLERIDQYAARRHTGACRGSLS